MEWGSSYIYDYQHSEEEEVSGSELEEGMWLSDSEGEEQEPLPHPPPPPHTNPLKTSKPGFLRRMFGRNKTGKDKTPLRASDSDTDDESDDPDDIEDKPQQVPDVNYAELDLSPKQDRDYLQIIKDGEEVEGSPGKYAQLAELQKQMKEEKKSSTDPHVPVVSIQDEDDITQTPLAAATALPPPPPPAPMKHLHGILKGGIKKQKKRRVRWDRSYRNKPKDSSRVGVRTRRTDTNVLAVKFNSLAEAGHLHTGDAEVCSNEECGAIVSHLTKLEGGADDDDKDILKNITDRGPHCSAERKTQRRSTATHKN